MIDKENMLTIIHDDNSTFYDKSMELFRYDDRDTYTMELDKDDDYLYVGFNKPFKYMYIAFSTANTTSNTLNCQYYDGSSWQSLDIVDESKGFTRDGLIQWDRPSDWESTEINSTDKYFIRFQPSATHSETIILGINLVFATDYDLKRHFPLVSSASLLQGKSSHLLIHEAVKDEILQTFRRKSIYKPDVPAKINVFDLHDISEVREGAIFLALSKIYSNASNEIDDHYYRKSNENYDKAYDLFDYAQVKVDTDNDGVEDDTEKEKFQGLRIKR